MDEGRFNLSQLTEKIRSYLEECLPDLEWVRQFKGTVVPSVPTGTVAADSMEFENTAKGGDMAVVLFNIYLVDPTSENGVEEKAMEVREALIENDTLDGFIQMGNVAKIQFGAVMNKAGACLISYKAKLWL